MNEGKENMIIAKSYSFALEIVQLYKTLVEKKAFVLSKQILRSGTFIGANIHEAVAIESKRDFVHKPGAAMKEASETSYWLNFLNDGQFISIDEFEKPENRRSEQIKILNSIIFTVRQRYFANS